MPPGQAGVSVRIKVVANEIFVKEEDLEDHILVLEAKAEKVDLKQLLPMKPDSGTTNIRNRPRPIKQCRSSGWA